MKNEIGREIVIMAGGPAAGKSTVRAASFSSWIVVDCDEIKKEHPAYDPKNPSAVHDWSNREAQTRIAANIEAGVSFVYDTTGTAVGRIAQITAKAHEFGFTVRLVYVTCSLATALVRNANRERVVPEYVVREKYATIESAVSEIRNFVDVVEVIPNEA